jgi:hypothetical protein
MHVSPDRRRRDGHRGTIYELDAAREHQQPNGNGSKALVGHACAGAKAF